MARYDGRANLIPMSKRTKEEAKEMGTLGGKMSGISRKNQKIVSNILKYVLVSEIPEDSPLGKNLRSYMKALGLNGPLTPALAANLGLLRKAFKGDPKAYEVMRDTAGEKPNEVIVNGGDIPTIVISPTNPEWVEEEKRKQDAAVREMKNMQAPSASKKEEQILCDEAKENQEPIEENSNKVIKAEKAAVKPVFYAPKR